MIWYKLFVYNVCLFLSFQLVPVKDVNKAEFIAQLAAYLKR